MRVWRLLLLLAVLGTAPPVLAADDHPLKGVALVIGESGYAHLPTLENPANDEKAIAELFGNLGFDVTTAVDADRRKLQKALDRFAEDAADADVAVIYYSGHGIEADGEDFLVPTDADLSTPTAAADSLVSVSALVDSLRKAVPISIVLLDACRSNGLPAGTTITLPGGTAAVPIDPTGLAIVRGTIPVAGVSDPQSLGMVVGFAAAPGQAALDGPAGSNSPYAAALLKHLGAGGYSFGDVMTMVSEEVYLKTDAKQLPWTNSSLTRVLNFGHPATAADPDETAIADGRRKLLLSIAATPADSRAFVEAVAAKDGVPLDQLYGMLKVLGVDVGSDQSVQQKLEDGAKRLKEFIGNAPGGAKSDPELAHWSGLADEAQNEGAMDLALKYRASASARADALSKIADANEAAIKSDREQIAQTYAEYAATAQLNFDYPTAAEKFGEAYDQVVRWDQDQARRYKVGQAAAFASVALFDGDSNAAQQAIAAFQSAYDLLTATASPQERMTIIAGLAYGYTVLGNYEASTKSLEQGEKLLRSILDAPDWPGSPKDRALVDGMLGEILMGIGSRAADPAKIKDSVAALRSATAGLDPMTDGTIWAVYKLLEGRALSVLGGMTGDSAAATQGVAAVQAAVAGSTGETNGEFLQQAQLSLGMALLSKATLESGATASTDYNAAIASLQQTVAQMPDRVRGPMRGQAYFVLGTAQAGLGNNDRDAAAFRDAIATFTLAENEFPKDLAGFGWAGSRLMHGKAEVALGSLTNDEAMVSHGIESLQSALPQTASFANLSYWESTQSALAAGYLQRATMAHSLPDALQARAAMLAAQAADRKGGTDLNASDNQQLAQINDLIRTLGGPP